MNFEDLTQKARQQWRALQDGSRPLIQIGTATCGRSAGAMEVLETFRQELSRRRIDVQFMEVGCLGSCYAEPLVCITKPTCPGICYANVTPEKALQLIEGYLVNDDCQATGALGTLSERGLNGIGSLFETPVFKRQVRRTLGKCGIIDPTNMNHYLAHNGYQGLVQALRLGPEQVIEEVKAAGLRGRGGAGFPTWRKWQFCREAPGGEKYLVCNADEGDPGAFMNRSLLEGDPHALLEGMLIAGFALGAQTGYIYCRAEYPLALERLHIALKQASDCKLLGDNILGSGFNFHIKVKEGAGAFVCGEETALIASIEGRRGMPRPRPPFPAVSGLWGKPTIINNVETLACVSLILQNGASWFAQYGTEKSKGTKTFALVGKVKRTGLIEVPLGITLREIIFDIGGGVLGDKRFKAVQTGGPSGGCIPAELLDTPVDYDSLTEAGTIMGSGGMVVMDEENCMVDIARYFLDFARKESCGECVPCRLGTSQLLDILNDITQGKGKPEDIDLLLELGEGIKLGSLCGLGQTAPNPVLTTIRYFRDEYEAHIKYKRCPAVVCREIVSSPCQHVCPIDTEAQGYISLIAQKRFQEAFDVILKDNPLPSVCGRVCHHPCESKCQAGKWGKPIVIRALKRFAADYAAQAGTYHVKKQTDTGGEKVAIVGSGPAGLMAGYRLAQKGYDVTIFEELDVIGGGLMVYIPEFRLPRDVLLRDIENISNAGVKFKTKTKIGKDISFAQLRKDFRAVFIAAGAHKSRKLFIPNEQAEGVMDAVEFLRDVNAYGRVEKIGRTVGVIGGGNAAVDAARVAVRLPGCEKVIVIYRRSRAEMPAFEAEVEALFEEGIRVQFLTAPKSIIAEKGKINALECIRMELGEKDKSGRRRPVAKEGTEFIIELDNLIVAIGEDADTDFLDKSDLKVSKWGTVETDPETMATNIEGVFAGGDVVTGANTVIAAMGAGKVAAAMIDKYLKGEKLEREYAVTRPSFYIRPVELTEEELQNSDRPVLEHLLAEKRRGNFAEVEMNMTEEAAVREARRCLRCDLDTEDARKALG